MKDYLYICFYQYSGQETEGRVEYEQKFICRAIDKAEALWKYHIWLSIRKGSPLPWKSLEDYRKLYYASGGWGFSALKLDEECDWRDDEAWFYDQYNKIMEHL